jgi:putative DNA primase/helicase
MNHTHPTHLTSQLLQNGFALVPIPYGRKGPQTVGWNLRQNVTVNPTDANRLKGMNVGLAHAYCTPNPTCALDIDHYPGAKAWLTSHSIDLDALIHASDQVVIHSGKRHSLKLIYRLPAGQLPLESKKINGIDGKSALEFRCATKDGYTVQDVLPPSLHPDGQLYVWLGDGNPLQPPYIPQELLSVWHLLIANCSRVALRKSNSLASSHPRPETPRQVATVSSALSYIDANCDYEKWRNVVWAVLSTGWLCAEDMAYQWSMTAPDRFEEDAFWLVANSYIPDLPGQITLGTLIHHAGQGGWHA